LISQLVRVAVQAVALQTLERVLAQGEPPADALAALQARLEAEEPAPLLWYGMRGERAGANLFFEGLRNGTIPAANVSSMFGTGRVGGLDALSLLVRLPGFVTAQHAAYL